MRVRNYHPRDFVGAGVGVGVRIRVGFRVDIH